MKRCGFSGILDGRSSYIMKHKPYSIYILYGWLIIFGLIPLVLIFFTSFLTQGDKSLFSLPFTAVNYLNLLSPEMGKIFLRSIVTAMATTVFCLLFAYPFSYLLIKSKLQSILILLIIIPFWTSSLVRTYSLVAILKFNGILNTILLKLHIIEQPLSLLYSHFAVICGLVYTLFPFMVLPIFSNMERFDFKLIEAAQDLGANRLRVFFTVFLPNTMGGVLSGCLLVFLPAMTLFYIPNILGGARSILLGNVIQSQFLVLENWPQGAATSAILTGLVILLLLFYRRPTREVVQ